MIEHIIATIISIIFILVMAGSVADHGTIKYGSDFRWDEFWMAVFLMSIFVISLIPIGLDIKSNVLSIFRILGCIGVIFSVLIFMGMSVE